MNDDNLGLAKMNSKVIILSEREYLPGYNLSCKITN